MRNRGRRGQCLTPAPSPVLLARAHRAAALADFDIAATELDRLRRLCEIAPSPVDPAAIVAAEARTDRARTRFWTADAEYQSRLDQSWVG